MSRINIPHRIILKGLDNGRHEEGLATVITKPGSLLIKDATGTLTQPKYKPHNVAGGAHEKAFALEDALRGRTINTDYAVGDLIGIGYVYPGDVVFALIDVGQNIAVGDKLSSAGDGSLRKEVSTGAIVGFAEEAVDLTESGDVQTRIAVRIA